MQQDHPKKCHELINASCLSDFYHDQPLVMGRT